MNQQLVALLTGVVLALLPANGALLAQAPGTSTGATSLSACVIGSVDGLCYFDALSHSWKSVSIAPAEGGCGAALPTGLIKGSGTSPCTAAVPNVDFAPSASPIFTGLSQYVNNGYPHLTIGLATTSSGDPFTSPDAITFGGTSELTSAQTTLRGAPYGPTDLGALSSEVMSDRPLYGSRAGIAPNNITEAAAYYDLDAVVKYQQTTSVPPRFIASSAYADAVDGLQHTVTYSANRVLHRRHLP